MVAVGTARGRAVGVAGLAGRRCDSKIDDVARGRPRGLPIGIRRGPVETRLPLHGFGVSALTSWLAERGLSRENVTLGPVIGRELFFLRDLSVPTAALGALPKILDQEVLRRTPFQLSQIWHAGVATAAGAGDVVLMCHWIIRKDRAEAALAELGFKASDIDFIAARTADGEVMPVISLGTPHLADPPWVRAAIRRLAVAGLCSVLLGLVAFEWCQASVATGIEASLMEAREGAQDGHDGFGEAARLYAMKADPGVLDIWNELSRVLPDHTFLTETRIADGKVTLSGFSADAARLIRTIDQSPLFTGATLAAAITPDAKEHKDRFSIGFRVRVARTVRTSGNVGNPRHD
jgi:general secretion pathway protein L